MDTTSWREQFNEAMNVNGGDIENATFIDYVLHFISFFWKVSFNVCIHVYSNEIYFIRKRLETRNISFLSPRAFDVFSLI